MGHGEGVGLIFAMQHSEKDINPYTSWHNSLCGDCS